MFEQLIIVNCQQLICLFFQILALFHVSLGQQLNLFWVHKVLVFMY